MKASPRPRWFKSSYSGGSGTECVECAHAAEGTLIRDSKRAGGPVMRVPYSTWHTFVRALAQEELS
jgi:hypothetical protein